VDDRQADSDLSPGGSKESVSESHQAQWTTSETHDEESTQTLTIPLNGSSPRKIEANRRNAKKSTGPKTPPGKAMSSWDSARHGLLSERLPLIYGKNKRHFARLLTSLRQDLEPVGTVEEVLVERIAQEYWRLGVAAWHEGKSSGDPADCEAKPRSPLFSVGTSFSGDFNYGSRLTINSQ